jgi:hypothetical protein
MAWLTSGRRELAALLLLLVVAAGLLLALPPEHTLGAVIRVIFLHSALVQVGLMVFAAAGILALLYLWRRDPTVYRWLVAAQRTGVAVWVVYALASMLSTYLAWGQWIAWDEPRVRASAGVLWFAVACWLLAWWVASPVFRALANLVLAGAAWWLVKGAAIFRHPFDPIGESGSPTYRLIFVALLLVLLLITALLMRRLRPANTPA